MSPPSRHPPLYGQIVIGPPGSGKTTYCDGMVQYLRLLGREAVVINLDPANDYAPSAASAAASSASSAVEASSEGRPLDLLPYHDHCILDVCEEIVNLSSVTEDLVLGPNGGLMYCMEVR